MSSSVIGSRTSPSTLWTDNRYCAMVSSSRWFPSPRTRLRARNSDLDRLRQSLENLDAARAGLGQSDGRLEVRRLDDRVSGRLGDRLASNRLAVAKRGAAIHQIVAEFAEEGHPGGHDLLAFCLVRRHLETADVQVQEVLRGLHRFLPWPGAGSPALHHCYERRAPKSTSDGERASTARR